MALMAPHHAWDVAALSKAMKQQNWYARHSLQCAAAIANRSAQPRP